MAHTAQKIGFGVIGALGFGIRFFQLLLLVLQGAIGFFQLFLLCQLVLVGLVQRLHIAYRCQPHPPSIGTGDILLDDAYPQHPRFGEQMQLARTGQRGEIGNRVGVVANQVKQAVVGGGFKIRGRGIPQHLHCQLADNADRQSFFIIAAQNTDAVVFAQQRANQSLQLGRGDRQVALIKQSFLIAAFDHHNLSPIRVAYGTDDRPVSNLFLFYHVSFQKDSFIYK